MLKQLKREKMKKFKNIFFLCLSVLVAFTACTDRFDDLNQDELNPEYTPNGPVTTIADLKTQFESSIITSKDTRAIIEDDIIIRGVVTANDLTGNFYKGLYIQDETAAIKLSVDATHLCASFHLGQKVVVNCKGLYIGSYRKHAQIGSDYNGTVGRMSLSMFNAHVFKDGISAPENEPKPVELTSTKAIENLQDGMLVKFTEGVFPTAGYAYFADATSGEAGTASTSIILSDGSKLTKRTSNYGSGIANQVVPTGKGSITGILSRYNNVWQITIRSIDDLAGFDMDTKLKEAGKGTKAEPYSAIGSMSHQSGEGWVKGYIVGVVNGISISETALFEETPATATEPAKKFTATSNVLIADSPNERNYFRCIPVQLPTGEIRNGLNLVTNKELLGKEVLLYGSLTNYFGVPAMKNTGCAYLDDGTKFGVDISNAIFYEAFGASQGNFKIVDVQKDAALSNVWSFNSRYGMVASGYKSGSRYNSNSWLVSPALDLSSATSATLSFMQACNFFSSIPEGSSVWITDQYTDGNDIDETKWTQLTIPNPITSGSWNFKASGDIDINAFAGKANVHVAFKYKSTPSNAGTWEVQKVLIQ